MLARQTMSASQLALSTPKSSPEQQRQQQQQQHQQVDQQENLSGTRKRDKKAARAKRCKSLLMLSSPFSCSATATMKSSLLSLLHPNHNLIGGHLADEHLCHSTDRLVILTGTSSLNNTMNTSNTERHQDSSANLNLSSSNLNQNLNQSQNQNQATNQQRAKCVKMKLFEQPLDKLFSPKAIKQLNSAISSVSSSPDQVSAKRKRSANSSPSSAAATLRKFSSMDISSNDNCNLRNSHHHLQNSSTQLSLTKRRRLMMAVLPEPIKNLLVELYLRGPDTVGIFRKSPNARHCKELRQKLEADSQSSIEDFQVNVIASVFKEWLRSLPDCLLMSRLYPQWIDAAKLIEPLHKHRMQCSQSQSLDDSNSDNANGTSATSLGPLTDSSDHKYDHNSAHHKHPLDRALSCSTVMADYSPAKSSISSPNKSSIIPKVNLSNTQANDTTDSSSYDIHNRSSIYVAQAANYLGMRTIASSGAHLTMSEFALAERHSECLRIVRQLLDALNESNLILLRSIICVLWHIANNSEHNKMSANNLGVCIGQSLLNDDNQSSNKYGSTSSTFSKRHRRTRSQCILSSTLSLAGTAVSPTNFLNTKGPQETAKYVPILVAFMIENATSIFGHDITSSFECEQVFERRARDTCETSEISSASTLSDSCNLLFADTNGTTCDTNNAAANITNLTQTDKGNLSPNSLDQVDQGICSSMSSDSETQTRREDSPEAKEILVPKSRQDLSIKDPKSKASLIRDEPSLKVRNLERQSADLGVSDTRTQTSNASRTAQYGSETTRILIVNSPKKPKQQSTSTTSSSLTKATTSSTNIQSIVAKSAETTTTKAKTASTCAPNGGHLPSLAHEPQHRPLSAESTSSSRASSSASASSSTSSLPYAYKNQSNCIARREPLMTYQQPIKFTQATATIAPTPSAQSMCYASHQRHQVFHSAANLNSLQPYDQYLLYQRNTIKPQRSNVMYLRDYYLSLQHEQMIQQQQLYAYRDRIQQRQQHHNHNQQQQRLSMHKVRPWECSDV